MSFSVVIVMTRATTPPSPALRAIRAIRAFVLARLACGTCGTYGRLRESPQHLRPGPEPDTSLADAESVGGPVNRPPSVALCLGEAAHLLGGDRAVGEHLPQKVLGLR